MDRKPPAKISSERKGVYQLGQGLSLLGAVLFAIPFFAVIGAMISRDPPGAGLPIAFGVGFVGFIVIAIGASLMNVGRQGVAGSGLVLDPDRARKDLEPWNRAAGGMVNDTLSEVEVINKLTEKLDKPAEPAIKVRCRECAALNDEIDRFCGQCGKPL